MQMVSVLALNKLELKEMIDAEMVENPVLEEIDESVPMLDEVAGRQEQRKSGRSASSISKMEQRNPRPHLKIPSMRLISVPISRSILTPATAPSRNMRRAKDPRLRTFSPSPRLSPITWRGNWAL